MIASTYNTILSQPKLNALRAMVSTYHLLKKFPTMHGIGEVHESQTLAWQCYLVSCQAKLPRTFPVEGLDTKDELSEERGEPKEDLLTIPLDDGDT